ncbi:Gamma-butyrobetaine dioxygenase [Armadillidium vulgare]|nr:Gamma-butyrobetaine dioxygenase [Armadillidium vulgare]
MTTCALLTWLQQLEVFGFVLISNAPAEYGQVRQLVERVGFIKKTHYGAEFSVKAKPDPSNVAYSSGPLQLHTDLPYYEYKPGLQLIHCIIQFKGEGGESQIADASHVARELKKNNPDMFKVLSETPVDWCDVGSDEGREFFKVFQSPIICLDSNGEIKRINFSHPQRDSFFNVDVKTAVKWYEAMKTYQDMLYDAKYCIQFKMTPGTIQSFDNLRIVHGRRSYEETAGQREIEGCYMDWDEARSKRRVLEKKLNLSSDHWNEQRSIQTGLTDKKL